MSNCGMCTSRQPDFNSLCDCCEGGSCFKEIKHCDHCGEVIVDDYLYDATTDEVYCSTDCLLSALNISIVEV